MLQLTDKELLVLAVMLGAKNFYGKFSIMKDPFRGIEQREIWAEVPTIQLELEKKGYITLGFDDNFKIMQEAQDLISVCAHSEKYIILDSIVHDDLQSKSVLYLHDGQTVYLRQKISEWELKSIAQSEYIADLQGKFAAACEKTFNVGETVLLGQATLEQAAKQSDSLRIMEILQESGCSLAMAEILLAGFRQENAYYAMQFVDLAKRSVETLNYLCSEQGNLQIMPAETEDNLKWQIIWVDKETINSTLVKAIQHFVGGVA